MQVHVYECNYNILISMWDLTVLLPNVKDHNSTKYRPKLTTSVMEYV